ncbi:hypothetical protein F4780DRAFT_667406 [Xylariomycetidae sp. FL0641]|nr:hypothetical protein F4780DRAFT_667406 [Xylariomycetidae sp. FL0641]
MAVALPADVYHLIFAHLPVVDLLRCRLTNRYAGSIATVWAFRHVRLDAYRDRTEFIHLARSEALRGLVQEITIDAQAEPDSRGHYDFVFYPHFCDALPLLRYFTSIKTLNVRFDPNCDSHELSRKCMHVWATILRCLTGGWTPEWQEHMDRHLLSEPGFRRLPDIRYMNSLKRTPLPEPTSIINLRTLTVSAFGGYSLPPHIMDEFCRFTKSSQLEALKLFISKNYDNHDLPSQTSYEVRQVLFEAGPKSWLAPAIAQNLRVLSLYDRDYWGWDPRMDFRTVNPASPSGFPNLKVLALGHYVFSHQWQIDWVESLGRDNGQGGLLELYLDNCPIMWSAHTLRPMDPIGTHHADIDGHHVELSNAGYPVQSDNPGPAPPNMTVTPFHLRWGHVLRQWKDGMTSLKVFKMGHGLCWDDDELPYDLLSPLSRRKLLRVRRTAFLNYDGLKLSEEDTDILRCRLRARDLRGSTTEAWYEEPRFELQYVQYNQLAPDQWIERDEGRQMIDEGRMHEHLSNQESDKKALAEFKTVVRART